MATVVLRIEFGAWAAFGKLPMAKRGYPEGSLLTTIGFLVFGKQQAVADSEIAMN